MNTIQLGIYVVLLCMEIMGISIFMESYKKVIRKDKAFLWETKGIGLVSSVLAVLLLVGISVFKPVLGLIGAPIWADYILYTIVIYFMQMQADMKVIKKVIMAFLPSLLKKAGMTDEQIAEVLEATKLQK